MERAAWLERRFGAQIEWRPFELHPEYPPEGIAREDLERRYGFDLTERHRAMFEPLGLPYAGAIDRIPNSRRSQMLAELARDRGVFDALHPRLFDAYWGRGRDIGDQQVLVEEGSSVGLEKAEIIEALENELYLARIREQTRHAIEIGATGVPAWLIDERFLVPGAQPHELFEQVMERTGHAAAAPE